MNSAQVFETGHAFQQNLQKLKSATSRAFDAMKAAEERVFTAKKILAKASATFLAENPASPAENLPEHKALADAQQALDYAKLAYYGCQNAEQAADPTKILEALDPAMQEYRAKEIEKYLETEYRPAAEAFLRTLHKGQGLAAALGLRPSLENPTESEVERHLAEALLTGPRNGNWRANPDAFSLYEQVKPHHILMQALLRHQAERQGLIERGQHQSAPRGSFDAAGKYRVISAIRIRGRDFEAGSIVDLNDMQQGGLALLARLAEIGRIRLLSEQQVLAQK
jgi:hypothetical protein